MTIRIRVIDEREVTIHTVPSWWEIWRGETDEKAIGIPCPIHGMEWVSDRTDRAIRSRRVLDEIDRAMNKWLVNRAAIEKYFQ